MSTTLFIDGAHTLRRSMYITSLRELSTSRGMPSGGVYGFMNSLAGACANLGATSVIVCWEGGHSERRKTLYEGYKVRDTIDEVLDLHGMTDYEYYRHQMSWIEALLDAMGIPQVRIKGKEGDDVLYQSVHLIDGKKIIISDDKDFYALIDDNISVYRPVAKEYIDIGTIGQYGNCRSPIQYLYKKALLGDGSDCIPQVAKGVGEATVNKLLDLIPDDELSPERIVQEAAKSPSSRTRKIAEAGVDVLRRNIELVDISRESFNAVELNEIADILSADKVPNYTDANKILGALEFSTDTIGNLVGKLTPLIDYPLKRLVNREYIRKVLMGVI